MSDSDYKMGQQGLRFDRTMNKEDYDGGKADGRIMQQGKRIRRPRWRERDSD